MTHYAEVIGHPIAHSKSPLIHKFWLTQLGMVGDYRASDVKPQDLERYFAERAADTDWRGCNITIPHKEAAAGLIARCTPVARRVGAVNTFWTEHGALVGHNTDVQGAAATITALCSSDVVDRRDLPVVLIGAGGSAAATLVALHDLGYRDLTIVARHAARAQALSARLSIPAQIASMDAVDVAVGAAALVINATPIGLRDDVFPVAVSALSARCAVFDLVYRPGLTPWIAECRRAGLRAEDGLRMLVEQGAAAFESWFDIPAPREAMWLALNAVPPTYHAS